MVESSGGFSGSRDFSFRALFLPAAATRLIGSHLRVGEFRTRLFFELHDPVAQCGGLFKLEPFGGLHHFGFEFGDILGRDVLFFARLPDGRIGRPVGFGIRLDSRSDMLANCFRRDAVPLVILGLPFAAARSLIDRGAHGSADFITV